MRTYVPLPHSTRNVALRVRAGLERLDVERGRRARDGALRSTSSPARASSCRRRPPTFTADTIGGTCSMSPTNAGSARSTSSLVIGIGRWSTTSPAASSVLGRDAEHDAAAVGLARLGQVAQQPRGATEPDEQHAGGVGIEGARVTDPTLPVDLAQLGHDVVRREAGRLVDDDQAVAASRVHGRFRGASRMVVDDRGDVERST